VKAALDELLRGGHVAARLVGASSRTSTRPTCLPTSRVRTSVRAYKRAFTTSGRGGGGDRGGAAAAEAAAAEAASRCAARVFRGDSGTVTPWSQIPLRSVLRRRVECMFKRPSCLVSMEVAVWGEGPRSINADGTPKPIRQKPRDEGKQNRGFAVLEFDSATTAREAASALNINGEAGGGGDGRGGVGGAAIDGRGLHSSTFRLNFTTSRWIRWVHDFCPVY